MPPFAPETPPEDLQAHLQSRYFSPLMAYFLRRIHDRVQAQDMTQEVLTRVLEAARRAPIEYPERFVFRIAANLMHDRKREALRAGDPDFISIDDAMATELASELTEDSSPERVVLHQDTLADVIRTVKELGDKTWEIFALFKLENMKQKDIAALYGIGQSTVEKHIMRAMLRLAERYGNG
jgi:RNA polymerase sigma factor (sigma-70 family)